jgi:hypothetical protein
VFALFGQADADSSGGHTYYFHKVYVGEEVVERVEEGGVHAVEDPDLDLMDGRLRGWLQRAHLEYVCEGRTRTHVSHTGYWSSGVDVEVEMGAGVGVGREKGGGRMGGSSAIGASASGSGRSGSQEEGGGQASREEEGGAPRHHRHRHRWSSEDVLGVWGMGLYGVWETSSVGSHFDLQKGGVFRAEPVIA